MIDAKKQANALYSLNTVLVVARHMAQTGGSLTDVAQVLDVAEYLVRLIAEDVDATPKFREQLADLAMKFAPLRAALDRFDRAMPAQW